MGRMDIRREPVAKAFCRGLLADHVAEMSRPAQICIYIFLIRAFGIETAAFSIKLPYCAFITLAIGLAFAAAWRAKSPLAAAKSVPTINGTGSSSASKQISTGWQITIIQAIHF